MSGDPATVDDAAEWRDVLGLSIEVLADTDEEWADVWGDASGGRYVQHSYTVIHSDGTVAFHEAGNSGGIEDRIIEAVLAAH